MLPRYSRRLLRISDARQRRDRAVVVFVDALLMAGALTERAGESDRGAFYGKLSVTTTMHFRGLVSLDVYVGTARGGRSLPPDKVVLVPVLHQPPAMCISHAPGFSFAAIDCAAGSRMFPALIRRAPGAASACTQLSGLIGSGHRPQNGSLTSSLSMLGWSTCICRMFMVAVAT
jgi:hypothetical protein